ALPPTSAPSRFPLVPNADRSPGARAKTIESNRRATCDRNVAERASVRGVAALTQSRRDGASPSRPRKPCRSARASDRQQTLGEEFQFVLRALVVALPARKSAPAEGEAEVADEARLVRLAVERGIGACIGQRHGVAVVELLILDGKARLGLRVPAENRPHVVGLLARLRGLEPAFALEHEMVEAHHQRIGVDAGKILVFPEAQGRMRAGEVDGADFL